MIFGDTGEFAIEAELQTTHEKWIYGRLRFWVRGLPIGDAEATSDLASSARWGRRFLAASTQRTRAELDALPASEVFEVLYGRYVQPLHSPDDAATTVTMSTGAVSQGKNVRCDSRHFEAFCTPEGAVCRMDRQTRMHSWSQSR